MPGRLARFALLALVASAEPECDADGHVLASLRLEAAQVAAARPESWATALEFLSKSEAFARHYWLPGQAVVLRNVGGDDGVYMDEVLAAADAALLERTNDAIMLTSKKHAALAAGKATFVGGAKGKAAKGAKEPPAMDAGEVGKKTRAGSTLIIDRATALFPRLARLAAVASGAFGLPANINLYCTAANLTVSVPAHNDAQDTLLMQFEGRKRWVLYTPQSKVIGPHATDGMLRGKGDSANAVPAEEVQQIALDVVLEAGDLLYVPRGMVHATSTELAWVEGDEAYSIHGTLALETDVAQATVSRAIICAAGLAAKDGSAEWSNYQEKMYFLQTFHAALQRADQSTRRDSAQLRRTLAVGFLASLQPSAADATMLQRVALSVVIPWSQDGDPKLRKDDLRRLVKGHHYEAAVATILNGATELQGRLASAYASFAHEAPKNAKELRRRQLGVLASTRADARRKTRTVKGIIDGRLADTRGRR